MEINFEDKSVVVIGGTSGINLGIAEKFAQSGAKLAVASRSEKKVDDAVNLLSKHKHNAIGHAGDVRDYKVVEEIFKKFNEQHGEIDVLISGAAGNFPAPAMGISSNGFKAVVDIDLLGTFHVMRSAYPYLKKPGASVINISAPQAYIPLEFQIHVCAAKSGVDMVCIELEDGIAPKDKNEARKKALSIFQNQTIPKNVEVILRINSIRSLFGLDDIRAILSTDFPPPAIMLPKVNDAEEVKILDDLLNERGHNCELHPIIETNSGLEKAYDIAKSSERVSTLFFGLIDMSAELRCKLSWDQLLYARSRVVHAAAGAGLDAIDGPFMDLEDPKGNIEQAILARDLGFSGKGSIHPKQVNDLNKVFTPSEEKIAKAKKITKIFEEANTGLVMVDGKLIEKPVLREMYRTLAISEESE